MQAASFTVTNLSDYDPNADPPILGSLRQLLELGKTIPNGFHTFEFDSNLKGTLQLKKRLLIDVSGEILGPGASQIAIRPSDNEQGILVTFDSKPDAGFFTSLHAAEPFLGSIEATTSGHHGGGQVEYLTNGKRMLIRQAGEGFKRASGFVDLTRDSYTYLQHHNHTYTEVGKLSDCHKIAEHPDHPSPPRQGEPLQVTATAEKRNLLGREAQRITVEGHGQTLEIWGCEGMPAFYPWFAFCPEPIETGEPEEQIGGICRERNVFPLLITRKLGETTTILFEVTKITPVKAEQTDHPALAEKTYPIPESHRLMPHPLPEMQRRRAEMQRRRAEME